MHSPTPWQNTNGTIESADGWHVASVHGHVGPETKKSNANIIAAAPELLEALETLLAEVDDHQEDCPQTVATDEVLTKVRAAIAKAKGE